METPKEYYYTYYSYEEWGRGYIGSRGCKCFPEKDIKYFGSFKDKNFKPTQKIILKSDYATREEAYADEIILQEYYKVAENSHFANRSYQTSSGFSTYGISHSEEHRKQNSEARKGEKHPFYGKSRSEETRRKQSEAMKGENNPNYGKSRSEESRKKQSESMKGKNKGKDNPMYGKSHSEESIRKMSEIKRDKSPSEESRRKNSESNKGKKWWNDKKGNSKKSVECPGKNWVAGRGKIKTVDQLAHNTDKQL